MCIFLDHDQGRYASSVQSTSCYAATHDVFFLARCTCSESCLFVIRNMTYVRNLLMSTLLLLLEEASDLSALLYSRLTDICIVDDDNVLTSHCRVDTALKGQGTSIDTIRPPKNYDY